MSISIIFYIILQICKINAIVYPGKMILFCLHMPVKQKSKPKNHYNLVAKTRLMHRIVDVIRQMNYRIPGGI
jgi:hypothetical protein